MFSLRHSTTSALTTMAADSHYSATQLKKILSALLLCVALPVYGQGAVVTLNGGTSTTGGGIQTMIGTNGQIQIYRTDTVNAVTATNYQNYVFSSGATTNNPIIGQGGNINLYNGIYLALVDPTNVAAPQIFGACTLATGGSCSNMQSFGSNSGGPFFTSSGGSTGASGMATTSYYAESINGCTYTVTVDWTYVRPNDYVSAVYNVTNDGLCGNADDTLQVQLYHLITTSYTKPGTSPSTVANAFVQNIPSVPAIVGGASDSTSIVEAFRTNVISNWGGYFTGTAAALVNGSQGGPYANPPSQFIQPGTAQALAHGMGVSWNLGLVGTGPLAGGGTFTSQSQDILFLDQFASVTKSVSTIGGVPFTTGDQVAPNQTIVYSIAVESLYVPSDTAGLNVILTETVPVSTVYTGIGEGWSCSPSTAAGSTCTQTINFASGTVGTTTTKTFTVQVLNPVTPSTTTNINNIVTCSTVINVGTGACTATNPPPIPIHTAPNLIISKVAPAGGFTAGVLGSYTITVTNNGTAALTGTATVGEQLPTGLVYASAATVSGLTGVSCVDNQPGAVPVQCTLTFSGGSLGINATASFTLQVTPAGSFNGGDNYAGVCTGSTCTTDCKGTLPLPPNCIKSGTPNLVIAKTAPAGGFTNGVAGSYTITVTNNGDAPYTATTFTVGEQLPAGLTYTGVTAGSGVSSAGCSAVVGNVPLLCTLTLSSNLAPNATASFTLQVTPIATFNGGDNYAGVCTGSTCTTDCKGTLPLPASCVKTGAPNLVITKTAPSSGFTNGVTGSYTITVTNNGDAPYTATTFTVGEQLPAGLTYTGVTAGSGVSSAGCSAVVGNVPLLCTLTLSSNLAVNGTASFTLQVTPIATFNGGDNYAGVCTGSTCTTDCKGTLPLPANCTKSGTPNLVITKTAPAGGFTNGVTGSYTITVTNNGDAPYTATTFTVGEQLPAGLTYTGVTAGSGL
ncbi:MAG: DUF11 domain-containing protein, partial [Ottowia sp.]|nr:DUF11 domain-containing protein [Ottowia sp.]